MTQSFADLKKNSSSDLEKLAAKAEEMNKGGGSFNDKNDEEYWKLTVDKAQNGSAIIRFLPAPPDEDVPFVRYWDHGFKGPTGQWYIEKSLTTIGKDDPVSEMNSELWATGTDENKSIVRDRKRRLHYVSNILVIKDPANAENNGKVFKFEYGAKIFDKVNAAMHPVEDELEPENTPAPFNPFNFWEGANFRLKARKVDGYRNYGESSFDEPKPLHEVLGVDEDDLEGIWKSEYALQPLVAPDQFKPYDDLQKRLHKVLGLTGAPSPTKNIADTQTSEPKVGKEVPDDTPFEPASASSDDDDDFDLNYFENLAKEA